MYPKSLERIKLKIGLLIGVMVGLFAVAAPAAVPTLINFQGKLLDASKNPENGSVSMTFSIWDDGPGTGIGSQLWSEGQTVSVTNGVFSVQLGAGTPITNSVFNAATTYLQIQIGAETASTRERLVTSPYAYRASVADSVSSGNSNYIQNTTTLQAGATFYVSSGTVAGPLIVGGVLITGTGGNQITTVAGLVDASKLNGIVPSGNISGTYSNSLTLSSNTNVLSGDGTGLSNVTAAHLLPGDTNYIHNRTTPQTGSTFYVSSGTVGGFFAATGTVTLGGVAGTNDVVAKSSLTINGNLTVYGAGPHVFTGDVRIGGNDLIDSGGTTRITLGSNNLIKGNLGVSGGSSYLSVSTSVALVGTKDADNFIAFPFTAGAAINAREIVYVAGANDVRKGASSNSQAVIGVSLNTVGAAGETVYVATSGIVTGVTAVTAVTAGNRVCSSTTGGQVQACGSNIDGVSIGKALTGAGAGGTLTILLR